MVLKPVIVLGVLLFVGAFSLVSYKLGTNYLFILAALLPVAGMLIVMVRYPAIGLILAIVGGVFVPFNGPSGINITVLGVVALIGIWIFKMITENRKISFALSRTIPPVLFFIVSAILSFIFGQLPWYSFANQAPFDAQIGGLLIFILSGGLFIAIPLIVKDIQWLKAFTWIFLGIGAVYVMIKMLGVSTLDLLFQDGFKNNSMFWTWMVALAFGQLIRNKELTVPVRLILVGFLGVTAYVAYFINGDWKSGYIPPLIAVATILAIRFPKLAVIASPFALAAFIWIASQSIASDQYSWGTRVDAWFIVLEITRISPILGMGFANYSFYTTLFPIRGYYVRFNSHSQYVDIVAQTGLIGLAAFLWIIFEIAWLGFRLRKKVSDGFSKGYVDGVLGGIAGSLTAAFLVDWILPYVYNIGFNGFRASILPWIFFGGLVSLEQLIKSQDAIIVR